MAFRRIGCSVRRIAECDQRHILMPNRRIPSIHGSDGLPGDRPMTAKFYSLIIAALTFAPFAYATLNQAAQIVA